MTARKMMATLLREVGYTSDAADDLEVGGIAYASNQVQPGDVFFCVVGFKADGHDYAPDAVARGAAALVCEHALDLDGLIGIGMHIVAVLHQAQHVGHGRLPFAWALQSAHYNGKAGNCSPPSQFIVCF